MMALTEGDSAGIPACRSDRICKSRREVAGDRNLAPVLLEASQSQLCDSDALGAQSPVQIVDHGNRSFVSGRNRQAKSGTLGWCEGCVLWCGGSATIAMRCPGFLKQK